MNGTIYQARSGFIFLTIGSGRTRLTSQQIKDLHLSVFELEDFDFDLYKSAYDQEQKNNVHVLIGQREGHQSVLAVKATHEEAKKADYRFSEFWKTDIEEWTIGEELSEPPDQIL